MAQSTSPPPVKQYKSHNGSNLAIPPSAEAIDYPDACGLVFKKGKYFGGWKPRWFVAKNGILYYFDVKDEKPVGAPMGSFLLSKCSAFHTSGGWTKGFSFRLSEHPSRAYLVALLSEPDMKFWINFISSASDSLTRRNVAATIIQSIFRGRRERQKWLALTGASVILQSYIRLWSIQNKYLLDMKKIHAAQSICKTWIARSHFKAAVKRKRIIAELLNTERSYVANLKLAIEVFIQPLLAIAKKEPWAKRSTEEIFSNWENIYTIHCTLLKGLEERSQTWTMTQLIGDIFIQQIENFKVYASYVNNFDKSVTEVTRLSKNSETFKSIVLTAQSDPRCKAMDLNDFLILPVQRLPRYSMLLKDLIKNTPRSHPDYQNLILAQDQVKEATVFINEQKRDADNLAIANDVKNQITGKLLKQLNFGPQPKFIMKGEAKCPAHGGDYAFLFSEVLLITKPKRERKYHLEDIIPLQNAIVTYGTTNTEYPTSASSSSLSISSLSPVPSPSQKRLAALNLEGAPDPAPSSPSNPHSNGNTPNKNGLMISKSENHVPQHNSQLVRKASLELEYEPPSSPSSSPPSHGTLPPLFPGNNNSRPTTPSHPNRDNYTRNTSSPSSGRTTPTLTRTTASPQLLGRKDPSPSISPTSPRVGLKAAPPARPHGAAFGTPSSSRNAKNAASQSSPAPPSSPSLGNLSLSTPPVSRVPRSPAASLKNEPANWLKVMCPQKEVLLVFPNADDVDNWIRSIQAAIAVLEEKKRAIMSSKVTMLYQ